MALDFASLTLNDVSVNEVSLASMPEELWRKVTSYLRPATTARAFVVAGGASSSLQKALRAEIEQTERDLFGATRRGAEELLVDDILTSDSSTTVGPTKLSSKLSENSAWMPPTTSRRPCCLSTSRPGRCSPTPTTRGPPARRQTTRRVVSRPSRGHLCK